MGEGDKTRIIVPVWHYTKGRLLPAILADGLIKPATAFVPVNEKPIVWFSTNQHWERTMAPGKDFGRHWYSMEETASKFGLARIGVDPDIAPYDFSALRELSGMTSAVANGLVKAAKKRYAEPREWRGTFEPVPRHLWIAIEIWRDGAWVRYEEAK